jgi:two-component system alkaline phosphatase synthesis response regulator PhoP
MTRPEDKTILIVDDEDDVRLYLETVLTNAGFKVETAADGLEALEKVKASVPDCISLDLVMPRKSGARFLGELHKKPEWKKIPVIIVTAHARDDLGSRDLKEILENSMISGPETYLEKPVTAESYVNAVKRALGMPATAGPEKAQGADLRKEVGNLLETAGQETLNKVMEVLRKK